MAKSRHNQNETFKKPATVNVVICRRPSHKQTQKITYRKLCIN